MRDRSVYLELRLQPSRRPYNTAQRARHQKTALATEQSGQAILSVATRVLSCHHDYALPRWPEEATRFSSRPIRDDFAYGGKDVVALVVVFVGVASHGAGPGVEECLSYSSA